MMHALLGPEDFRKAMDLYFERHDGDAATVENFVACMEDASGQDLGQFRRWYSQAGTPEVAVSSTYDKGRGEYSLTVTQMSSPSPGQRKKEPYHFPLALGLLDSAGNDLPLNLDGHGVLNRPIIDIRDREQTFRFTGLPERPVLSINRGFSAPVNLTSKSSEADALALMAGDTDLFNRWEAAQSYATTLLIDRVGDLRSGGSPSGGGRLAEALETLVTDRSLDPAFVAQMMTLPGEADLAREIGEDIDPGAIHAARLGLQTLIAERLRDQLEALYTDLESSDRYSPDAAQAGRRSLRNAALGYLTLLPGGPDRAYRQFEAAANMTDRMAALGALAPTESDERVRALDAFYEQWQGDHLVVDKWFALNAMSTATTSVEDIRSLMEHRAFSITKPNNVRALLGTLAGANPVAFNRPDGEGYRLIADTVLVLDEKNPQVAARLAGSFKSWRVLEAGRQAHAKAQLKRVEATEGLSRDTYEIVSKSLG